MSEADLDPLIRIAEGQLKNGDRQGVRATTGRLNDQLRRRREDLQSRLRHLEVLSDRSDELRRAAEGNEPPDPVRERLESSRGPTSLPTKGEVNSSSSDQERRLRQVEQTLERLLKERKGDG